MENTEVAHTCLYADVNKYVYHFCIYMYIYISVLVCNMLRVYVCMCVHVCACVCESTWNKLVIVIVVPIPRAIGLCVCKCVYVCAHTSISLLTNDYVSIYPCLYLNEIYTCIYHTHTHTHSHTSTPYMHHAAPASSASPIDRIVARHRSRRRPCAW